MLFETLRIESSLVILVDLTEGPLSTVYSMPQAELRRNVECFAEVCKLLQLPVIVARAPLPGAAAALLPEVTRHLTESREIRHTTNNSWEEPLFVDAVKASGRHQLIFAGIATDVGVGLTALSAVRAGFQSALLTDVSGTINVRVEQAAHSRLSQAGVVLTAWSSLAAEWQGNYTTGVGPMVLQVLQKSIRGQL